MRYNLEKRNRFAMRTLDAFSSTMFDLLETKSFETIMVSELCSLSNYPRATFYNYFEDKYDLLEYCWDILKSKVRLYDFKDLETDHRIYEVFGRIYDFFEQRQERLFRILVHNSLEGELYTRFKQYVKVQILEIMDTIDFSDHNGLPNRLWAEHYCNTILLVLEHSFLKEQRIDKETAVSYLRILLQNRRENMWTDRSVFYQIYPLGAFGCPFENDFQAKSRILRMKDWIPHLKKLGVDCILFNPVFESHTHGYDTIDYKKLDSRLGTNEDFAFICKLLHENGIRVVLDGVFNHVGRGFFAFQDVLMNRENSSYKDWFYINFWENNNYDDH